jgi:hypothetical protein
VLAARYAHKVSKVGAIRMIVIWFVRFSLIQAVWAKSRYYGKSFELSFGSFIGSKVGVGRATS